MPSLARALPNCDPSVREHSLGLRLRLLRQAIDDLHWKHDAVAERLDVEPEYFSKMLAGVKAFTLRHIELLPDDVEARWARLYAEFMGHTIVEPLPPAQAIGQALIAFGYAMTQGQLTSLLPGAGTPIKAGLK